jgi:hypothetical protein
MTCPYCNEALDPAFSGPYVHPATKTEFLIPLCRSCDKPVPVMAVLSADQAKAKDDEMPMAA